MATIWRFEKKFVESCSLVLDETLKLLACDLPQSLFLVGIHTKTNAVTIIPDNAVVADYELADVLVDSISESYAPTQTTIPYRPQNGIRCSRSTNGRVARVGVRYATRWRVCCLIQTTNPPCRRAAR